MFQVWMKNCLVSRAYCFRKLYVYIEDWIKFAFVQTVFCFSHFIFVPCLPVLAIIRSSISSGQKIEHWTSSDQRHFCATFFLTWPVWRTASQIISSCLTAKKKIFITQIKIVKRLGLGLGMGLGIENRESKRSQCWQYNALSPKCL